MTKSIVTFLGIGASPGFPLWAVIVVGMALLLIGFFAAALLAMSGRADREAERMRHGAK